VSDVAAAVDCRFWTPPGRLEHPQLRAPGRFHLGRPRMYSASVAYDNWPMEIWDVLLRPFASGGYIFTAKCRERPSAVDENGVPLPIDALEAGQTVQLYVDPFHYRSYGRLCADARLLAVRYVSGAIWNNSWAKTSGGLNSNSLGREGEPVATPSTRPGGAPVPSSPAPGR
jgi:hypothetical protein